MAPPHEGAACAARRVDQAQPLIETEDVAPVVYMANLPLDAKCSSST